MKRYNWGKELVQRAVLSSNCWFDCLDKLGIPKRGGNYRTLKKKVEEYNIDVSHFNYIYGKTHNGMRMAKNRKDEEIFALNSRVKMATLKREYIRRILGDSYKCEICGSSSHMEKPLVLQIHHRDGNPKNNIVSNLQLLCPNCHSQTENYSNRARI